MSDLRKYLDLIQELSEEIEYVELGDSFDIELNEDFVIETGVVGFTEDGIIIESDQQILDLLEVNSIICESEELDETGMVFGMGQAYNEDEEDVAEGIDRMVTSGHKIIANRETPKGFFVLLRNKNDGKYEIHQYNRNVVGNYEFISVHNTPEEMQAAFKKLTGVDESRMQGVEEGEMDEAKYQGREVPLGKPMAGDVKKSKVYVRKPNGKVVKVNFGDKKMRIKKSNPNRRKSFRARHHCENPGPRWKARYWSCRAW